MSVEIREVVSSFVLDVSGHRVHARITKDIDGSEGFSWDISHYGGGFSRAKKAQMAPVSSHKEALEQIIAYAQTFDPGYSPDPNIRY
ncbi:hypothetical protein MN546_20240 [Pseudomonas lundensis]|uniref:hypothetical protein n=1 Tax=Pseudomonas lundensis TaxID=86185 RepID=UPI001473E31C|nr:hypothetical protein [Pseudomonas lundensis]MCT8954773.1 hypothetical protein [Pseudomonas lundensis]NNA37261.1 hypothetical protein [Pseudomonas lundensis]